MYILIAKHKGISKQLFFCTILLRKLGHNSTEGAEKSKNELDKQPGSVYISKITEAKCLPVSKENKVSSHLNCILNWKFWSGSTFCSRAHSHSLSTLLINFCLSWVSFSLSGTVTSSAAACYPHTAGASWNVLVSNPSQGGLWSSKLSKPMDISMVLLLFLKCSSGSPRVEKTGHKKETDHK